MKVNTIQLQISVVKFIHNFAYFNFVIYQYLQSTKPCTLWY